MKRTIERKLREEIKTERVKFAMLDKERHAESTARQLTEAKLDRCLYWLRVLASGRVNSNSQGANRAEQTAAMALEEIAKWPRD